MSITKTGANMNFIFTDDANAWPTYGTSIVLPSPMFALSMQPMR